MTKLDDEIHPFNGDAYNLMGFIEMKNGNENGALIRLSDALRVRRALGNRLKEAETLKNIGNLHRERNNLDLALEQYEECLAIITEEQGRDSESVVDVLISMGSIMGDMNFYEDAISHYKNGEPSLLSNFCLIWGNLS
jgi:tetratricopeptide (TPR) repeat protein